MLTWETPDALYDLATGWKGKFMVLCRIPFTHLEIVVFNTDTPQRRKVIAAINDEIDKYFP